MASIICEVVGDNAVPHRLYDLSIEDLEERKQKSFVLLTVHDTMNFLGVSYKVIVNNRRSGKVIHCKRINKNFAVRIEKN